MGGGAGNLIHSVPGDSWPILRWLHCRLLCWQQGRGLRRTWWGAGGVPIHGVDAAGGCVLRAQPSAQLWAPVEARFDAPGRCKVKLERAGGREGMYGGVPTRLGFCLTGVPHPSAQACHGGGAMPARTTSPSRRGLRGPDLVLHILTGLDFQREVLAANGVVSTYVSGRLTESGAEVCLPLK